MTIATWNVNGIRARGGQVQEWLARDRPDIVCLQEIKALPAQVPTMLFEAEGYWCYWHGLKGGYSGVGLLVKKTLAAECPVFAHPNFDMESRMVSARIGDLTVASVYVPNGGKDFGAKMRFLAALEDYADTFRASDGALVLCGDINIARAPIDVHPSQRRQIIGQLPEERAAFQRILDRGLVDLGRAQHPDDAGLFTWWAPWRQMRQRNIGWRLDYVLASASLAERASACEVAADVGTSDHAPVVATFAH